MLPILGINWRTIFLDIFTVPDLGGKLLISAYVVNATLRMKYTKVPPSIWQIGMCLVFTSLLLSACSSSGFTKKQREALDHYVDETADAILFSATKVRNLLSTYKSEHGKWPKDRKERQNIFYEIDKVLEEHHISNQKLLEIDNNEVIVEYALSAKKFKQFPRLLESWVIIFSSENRKELDIISIFPHWCDSQKMSKKSLYSTAQVEKLRAEFQFLLQEKLDAYSIKLSEHINEKS